MATRSIVPRADGEGSVGTTAKKWGGVWAKKINGADPNWFYLVRENSKAYIVGDIAFSPSLPSAMFLECIEAGTTGASEPDYTGAAVGGTVQDGEVVWQYYDLLSGGGVPLGTILPYSANAQTPPYGFFFAEGQAVSRTMYADYFALVGTTYGEGDGSTTYNLPNLLGKYPQGDMTAGTYKSAGLPNITGIAPHYLFAGAKETGNNGALNTADITANRGISTGNQDGWTRISFDASQSNVIYGNSDTVTPPTLTCRWIVKVYDAPTPSSAQIDLSQYAQDLANRLTREQTPAFNHRDVVTTSGTYTAPVTGWYRITAKGGGGGGGHGYGTSASGQCAGGAGGGEGGTTFAYEHLTAGDSVSVVVGAGGAGSTVVGGAGSNGGDSSVTVNLTTYTGGGGGGGNGYSSTNPLAGGGGGSGTIVGAAGSEAPYVSVANQSVGQVPGGNGGGAGGGICGRTSTPTAGVKGGGGAGSHSTNNSSENGAAGGDGYVWFEYFAAV